MVNSCAPTLDSCVPVVKGVRGRCFEKTTGRERERGRGRERESSSLTNRSEVERERERIFIDNQREVLLTIKEREVLEEGGQDSARDDYFIIFLLKFLKYFHIHIMKNTNYSARVGEDPGDDSS